MSTDEVWHVLTRTSGGTVSLLKNLTEEQARGTMQRLCPAGNPWTDGRIQEDVMRKAFDASKYPDGQYQIAGMGNVYIRSGQVAMVGGGGGGTGLYHNNITDLVQVECFGPPDAELEVWPKPDDYDERYEKAMDVARVAAATNLARATERA